MLLVFFFCNIKKDREKSEIFMWIEGIIVYNLCNTNHETIVKNPIYYIGENIFLKWDKLQRICPDLSQMLVTLAYPYPSASRNYILLWDYIWIFGLPNLNRIIRDIIALNFSIGTGNFLGQIEYWSWPVEFTLAFSELFMVTA